MSHSWSRISRVYSFSFKFFVPKCWATGFLGCFLQYLIWLSWPLILRFMVCELSPMYFFLQQLHVDGYIQSLLWHVKLPLIFSVTFCALVTELPLVILSQVRQYFPLTSLHGIHLNFCGGFGVDYAFYE